MSIDAQRQPETRPRPVSRKAADVARRCLSGIVLIPVVIGAAWLGGLVFAAFVALVSVLGLRELDGIGRRIGRRAPRVLWILGGVAVPILVHRFGLPALGVAVTIFVLAALMVEMRHDPEVGFANATFATLGFVYVPVMLGHLVLLRDHPPANAGGEEAVLLVLILTWVCDTGAFAVGSIAGRRRLWPSISPKKTVEGAVAGIVLTVLATLLCRVWFASFLTPGGALALGLLIGVVCSIGDLLESMIKRQAGVKDTGRLIPGHGGILDRFDSMIVSAPLTYYALHAPALLGG